MPTDAAWPGIVLFILGFVSAVWGWTNMKASRYLPMSFVIFVVGLWLCFWGFSFAAPGSR
jgi:hypothetical protein